MNIKKIKLVNEKKQTKLFEEKEITKDDAGLAKKVSTETSDTDKLIVKDQKSTSVALKKEAPKATSKTTQETTQKTTTSTATKQTTQAAQTQTPVQSGSVAQAGSKQQAIYQAALAQKQRENRSALTSVFNSLTNSATRATINQGTANSRASANNTAGSTRAAQNNRRR